MKEYIIPLNIFVNPPVGTIDRKSVFKCVSSCGHEDEQVECYGFVDKKYNITACVILNDDSCNNQLILQHVWINEHCKKQGLGTLLILFILRKLCKRIVITHDSVVSEEVRDILLTAVEANKIKAAETKTLSTQDLQQLFDKLDNSTVVLEPSPSKYPLFAKEGLLAEALLIEKENTYI